MLPIMFKPCRTKSYMATGSEGAMRQGSIKAGVEGEGGEGGEGVIAGGGRGLMGDSLDPLHPLPPTL